MIFLAGLTIFKKGEVSGNVKYAVGTNNSTVEQLVVVMREKDNYFRE